MGRSTPKSSSPSRRFRAFDALGRAAGRVGERLAALLPEDGAARPWVDRIGLGLLAIGVLFVAAFGIPRLIERAEAPQAMLSREPASPPTGPSVRFAGDVSWLEPNERARIEISIAAELAGRSALDRESLAAAADAATRTGWFEGPVLLLRTSLDEVLVITPVRVPRAVVRGGGRDHLIDLKGVLLPLSWGEASGPTSLPVFLGVREQAPDRPGERWGGGTIAIGFDVLDAIAHRPWSGQVEAIDLLGADRGEAIHLRTTGGGTIVWGTSDPVSVAEVPNSTRLAYLDRIHRQAGSIEPPPGMAWDLRLDYLAARASKQAASETVASAGH